YLLAVGRQSRRHIGQFEEEAGIEQVTGEHQRTDAWQLLDLGPVTPPLTYRTIGALALVGLGHALAHAVAVYPAFEIAVPKLLPQFREQAPEHGEQVAGVAGKQSTSEEDAGAAGVGGIKQTGGGKALGCPCALEL